MANDEQWIKADDAELIASIVRHEGEKKVIFNSIGSGRLQLAAGCNAEVCKENDTWPAYIDSEGLDTVGIGHLITGDESYDCYAGVSDEDVKDQLAADVRNHLAAAKRLADEHNMNIDGNFVVQRFMTELCFNIGARGYGNFKNGLMKLTSAVNGDGKFSYNDAGDEHLDSRWAKQVGNRAIEMVDTLRALDA